MVLVRMCRRVGAVLAWGCAGLALMGAGASLAGPSGGPYGPQHMRYDIPAAAHVFYVAPDGVAGAPGTNPAKPTTLEHAVATAVTGNVVVLRGGVYRTGNLTFNQGIRFQPFADEVPILKGTQIARDWHPVGKGVWKTAWTHLYPAAPLPWWQRQREEAKTPLHRFNNDMVFVDGKMLMSAGSVSELDAHSYYIDYAQHEVYIGADPRTAVVEITAHDGALIRTSASVNGRPADRVGPQIRGLTFTQYAWRAIEIEGKRSFGPNDEPTDEPLGPADPATYGKQAVGTVLENVTISFCSRVAGYFRGDGLIIRNSLISDTGTEGIYVIGSADVLLERNIIRRNNIEHLTGYFASAVKIFNQSHRVVVRDNLVYAHPDSHGVWFDVGNRDGVFENNYVEGTEAGFMAEISRGMTVAGNVFVDNDRGVWALNSADVHVYANTFVNSPVVFERTERSAKGDLFGWHPKTGPDVDQRVGHVFVDNLLAGELTFRAPLLRVAQSAPLCGVQTDAQIATIDGNVYAHAVLDDGAALIDWAPVAGTNCQTRVGALSGLRAVAAGAEKTGHEIALSASTLFANPAMRDYRLRVALQAAGDVPPSVRARIGWPENGPVQAGAYPSPSRGKE